MHCNFNFYPGYPALTWVINRALHLPADYALWAVSLVASFVFLFLWTDRKMVRALGVGTVYTSLIAFNAFPTGFTLVTLQTEPCALVFTLAAFLCLARQRWLLGAVFAGAASAMRLNAAAVSVAMAAAIATELWMSPPKRWTDWATGLVSMVVSGWGVLAITGYHWLRYHDPLLYVHAHAETYGHTTSLMSVFDPKPEWLLRSIDHPLHEGVVCLLALIWFLLGSKGGDGWLYDSGARLLVHALPALRRRDGHRQHFARAVRNESLSLARVSGLLRDRNRREETTGVVRGLDPGVFFSIPASRSV